VRVATLTNVNAGIVASVRSLPLNTTTNVRVEAFGIEVLLFLNNSFDSMVTVSSRVSGEATLFVPNPWSTAALATIGSIEMIPILRKTFYAASSSFNGPLSKAVVREITPITPNFTLSFDIKPSGIVPSMASILHFIESGSLDLGAAGRMPGMICTNISH
jgi:hypothetical protein